MAVARKSHHILLGEMGGVYGGILKSLTPASGIELPRPIDITIGSDGLLLTTTGTIFAPPVALDQWPGVVPYVSSEIYFIPWEGIRGINTETDDNGDQFLSTHHLDDTSTAFTLPIVGSSERFLDECRGLPQGAGNLALDVDLWDAIQDILAHHPLISEDEILRELHKDYGWKSCTRTTLDEILWDEDFPAYYASHVWFPNDDTGNPATAFDPLVDDVLAALGDEGATAETILQELDSDDIELDDVCEVLCDPLVPTIKRARAWYHREQEGG